MSSGYTVNGTDLDAIFKPRYSEKRANVNISVSDTDISNIYEKTQVPEDKISFDTNIKYNNIDLKDIFAAISYKKLSFSYYTVGESYDRYGRANDGIIYITILQANYNESGTHNVTVQLGSIVHTAAFTTDSYTFSFFSQDEGSFPKSVTVTDTNSGKTNTFTIWTLGAGRVLSAVTTVNVY